MFIPPKVQLINHSFHTKSSSSKKKRQDKLPTLYKGQKKLVFFIKAGCDCSCCRVPTNVVTVSRRHQNCFLWWG